MVESAPGRMAGEFVDPEIEYRSVEPWAVGGLILGILSPVALLANLLWLVPPLGILTSAIALGRLKRETNRIGRTAALLGLGLSVLFAVTPLAQMASAFVLVRDQARPVADQFFDDLRHDKPERAVLFRVLPDYRQTFEQQDDDALWMFYRTNKEAKNDLTSFVALPVARTLLALGDRADIRFYKTVGLGTQGGQAQVEYWYTVTYQDESDKKKTFLVGLILERKPTKTAGLSPWRIKEFYGPVKPD